MKNLIVLLVSGALIVSGYSQTRNVLVGTNNRVVQPTNFWSADVTNARAGLGLGSAATNPATSFQPSSTVLSNLASSNGAGLTNLTAANITGTVGLASNVTGTIAISNGGSGATTAGGAVTNFFTPNTPLVFATNGQVVANTGTNVLTFTNEVKFGSGALTVSAQNISGSGVDLSFEDGAYGGTLYMDGGSIEFSGATNAATTRTNLGLGWSALTNSNAGTGLVSVNTNGEVVSPTNFWQVAPIQTLVQDLTVVVTTQTNNATNSRNLYVYSLATNVSGISNTILLPTNAATFAGDEVTVIHQGNTNTTTVVREAGSTNNLITLSRFDEAVKFIKESGQWNFYHNISYVEPIQFSGTNTSNNIAATRTNLGLGLPALTNTDVTNFRTAIGLGTTNNVAFSNIASSGTLTSTGVVTALSNAVVGGTLTSTGVFTALSNAVVGGTLTATGSVTALSNVSVAGTLTATGSVTTVTNLNVGGAINVTNKAETRTNLGIPLAALTQTNNANFQAAIFNTNSIPTNGANVNAVNFNTAIHWMEVNVVTNGVTNNFRIPLFK